MSIGDFPESLTQTILVGVMLVGRLGVTHNNDERFSQSRGATMTWMRQALMTPGTALAFVEVVLLGAPYPI